MNHYIVWETEVFSKIKFDSDANDQKLSILKIFATFWERNFLVPINSRPFDFFPIYLKNAKMF